MRKGGEIKEQDKENRVELDVKRVDWNINSILQTANQYKTKIFNGVREFIFEIFLSHGFK